MFGLKSIVPRSLFTRSLIILVTPLLLVQLITVFMFYDNHWSRMTSRLPVLRENVVDFLDVSFFYEPEGVLAAERSQAQGGVWDYLVAGRLRSELQESVERPFMVRVDRVTRTIFVDVQLERGVLHFDFPQRRLFSSSGYIVVLWMFGSSTLLLMIAIIFMRNQIRPIRKLAIAAERFGKGGDLVHFKPTGAREVRQAAAAFIEMHKRIRRQVDQRTTMLAGVSHDLRTPLTRLKLSLEMMGKGDDIGAMKDDVQDMERMISGYLDFARGAESEQASFTNFSDLLRKIAARIVPDNAAVKIDVQKDVYMMVKPVAMERALVNLVRNAERYGSHVLLFLRKEEERLVVRIEDDGPGIAEHQMRDVFKPFFRGDAARDTEHGHVGLGLSIALDIVQAHGGDIALERSDMGGLAVVIVLPL